MIISRRALRRLAARAALSLGTVALMAGVSPASVQAQEIGLPIGTQAPTGELETLDGKTVNLSQYVGKTPVLMEFWAWWCPNCKQLEPAIKAAEKKYAGKVKFIGVAVSLRQPLARAKKYAEDHSLTMEVLYDRKGLISDAYHAVATSYIVVLDAKGKVVYTGLGGDQNIEAAIRKAL